VTKSIATGYTDTAIAGSPTMQVAIGKLNYVADHRILVDTPGEVITTNLTCPVDQPETFRFSQRTVANVYASDSSIDAAAYLATKQGTATLLENREVWVETDSVDATYRKLIPVKCGITITAPSYGNITSDMLKTLLLRSVALAFETGVVTSEGLAALQRGVLQKKDLA